ncbi:MAG: tripartite tricarboxylate transporter TctB family protein [Hyphomicrobiaceae bacterium]
MSNIDDSSAGRTQQSIAAGIILALSAWVVFISFNVDDPQPYLFPRMFSIVMVILAAIAFVRALRGANRTGTVMGGRQFLRIVPVLGLMLLYVFVLIPLLGFYTAAAVSFFTVYAVYDPESHLSAMVWVKRLAITAGFIAVIYVVFTLGLKVQAPRALFI